jgi:hypothetical protein
MLVQANNKIARLNVTARNMYAFRQNGYNINKTPGEGTRTRRVAGYGKIHIYKK